jgi:hypothetical protein
MTVSSLTRPDITAVLANTGGGKTYYTKRHVLTPKPDRVLIWDFPFQEYQDHAEYVSFANLARRLHGVKKGARFALAVTGSVDNDIRARQFAAWCRLVMATARETGGLTSIVEELKDVTTASRAPTDWNILVRTGRKVGVRLVGLSQRPAQIDKDFLGQCTTIHCGPLGYEEDCKLMARELRGVTLDEIRALVPGQWIESSRETGQVKRGSLAIGAPAAKKSRRSRVT